MMRIDHARFCRRPAFVMHRPSAWAAALMLALCAHTAQAQPPHAVEPLPNPYFSLDPLSPTTAAGVAGPADVLDKPGPSPVYTRAGLGLMSPLDDVNGLSGDRTDLAAPGVTFAVLFSVDRATIGLMPPDPSLVAINRPFNVLEQAAKNQASADLFMSTQLFDLSGPHPSPLRSVPNNNTSVRNQGDTGGVDYDLLPEKSPSQFEPLPVKDDTDALIYPEPTGGPMRGVPAGGLFFSLSRTSPSLPLLNPQGMASGADIFFDPEPEFPGPSFVYVRAAQLGLMPGTFGDDISGLIVIDNGDLIFDPAVDRILFTLARGSPSLGDEFSPADIFIAPAPNGFSRFATAFDLGLAPGDHINGLEVLISSDIDDAIYRHALMRILPGDYDGNGVLDLVDCVSFIDCHSGAGVSYDPEVVAHSVDVGPGPLFHPQHLLIETGDMVVWTWQDGPHSVVSGSGGSHDGAFYSGPPTSTPGTSYSVEFDAALVDLHPRGGGVYHYFSAGDPLGNMVGSITVTAPPCATFDFDFDGDVDCDDWREFRLFYQQLNSSRCLPLSVPEFVAVLLDAPLHPVHVCFADMNGDGLTDGRDIQPFVDAYLALP